MHLTYNEVLTIVIAMDAKRNSVGLDKEEVHTLSKLTEFLESDKDELALEK